MAWGYKASTYHDNGVGVTVNAGSTTTIALGAAAAVGDRIVICIQSLQNISGSGSTNFTVSDNVNSGSYTEDATQTLATYPTLTNQPVRHSVWSKTVTTAGTPTITVGVPSGGGQYNVGLQCAAYTGLITSDPGGDVTAGATGNSTSASSGATSNTTAANELVLCSVMDSGEGTTITAGSGFTARGTHQSDAGRWQGILEDKDSGASATPQTGTATYGAAPAGWFALTVVYKVISTTTTYPITRSVTQAQSVSLASSKVFLRTVSTSQNQTLSRSVYLGVHYSITRSVSQAQSLSVATASANLPTDYYTTTFPLTENPMVQGGVWTDGASVGLDWCDLRTTPNKEFGTQTGNTNPPFNDSVAHLKGTWGNDQEARATVFNNLGAGASVSNEVELLLRFDITAHTARGYEIEFSVNPTRIYFDIVRWNGPLADATNSNKGYTPLLHVTNPTMPQLNTGDVVYAKIVGNTISGYVNGTLIGSVTDTGTDHAPWTSGRPGIGHYLKNDPTVGDPSLYGFSQYMAHTIGTPIPVRVSTTQSTAVSLRQQSIIARILTAGQPQTLVLQQAVRRAVTLVQVQLASLVVGRALQRTVSAVQAQLASVTARKVILSTVSATQAQIVSLRRSQLPFRPALSQTTALARTLLVRLVRTVAQSQSAQLSIASSNRTFLLSGTARPTTTLSLAMTTAGSGPAVYTLSTFVRTSARLDWSLILRPRPITPPLEPSAPDGPPVLLPAGSGGVPPLRPLY